MRRVGKVWNTFRAALVPVLLVGLAVITLREPLVWWLGGEERYDQEALKEWLLEAKVYQTLPELVGDYLRMQERYHELERAVDLQQTVRVALDSWPERHLELGRIIGLDSPEARRIVSEYRAAPNRLDVKREEIKVHLTSLGDPLTKMYRDRLPLFPVIYQLVVRFHDDSMSEAERRSRPPPVVWDSGRPRQERQDRERQPGQYKELKGVRLTDGAWADLQYQLRVYARQQYNERQGVGRWLRLSGLAVVLTIVALIWVYLSQRRANEQERQQVRQRQRLGEAERMRLQEELGRQEAERRREEAERTALELKSQLFANIGIMAGSYAHNIKNLLVRPNDLLGRCLEGDGLPADKQRMLDEVRQTLGTVTERLQQILQTVRRDPSKSERVRIDVNELAADMHQTWGELAREKWKLVLSLDLAEGPLWIEGDRSHLQQAAENLLFNARDATFEMRNQLRDHARQVGGGDGSPAADAGRRRAIIAAAAWKGEVTLRTVRTADHAILEVRDNGIGMTEEVKRRCTETHFSTKRDNALFAGLSAGMGLGLSFVVVILEHHRAKLEVESEPLRGTTFRIRFPVAEEAVVHESSPAPEAASGGG
jgi:signal transduction histidine kinase